MVKVTTVLLIVLALAQLTYFLLSSLPPSFLTSAATKLLAFLVCLRELRYDRGHGKTFSTKLCVFWVLMAFSSLVQYYSMLLRILNLGFPQVETPEDLIMDTLYHALVFSMCLLSVFHEISIFHPSALVDTKKQHVFQNISILSFLTFSWMDKGFRSTLHLDKLDSPPPHLLAVRVHADFDRAWKKQKGTEDHPRMPSLVMALVKAFWFHGLIANILELVYSFTRFIPPLVLKWVSFFVGVLLLSYMAQSNMPTWRGHAYAVLLLIGSIISGMATQHENFHSLLMSMQIKAALISTIYHKSLQLSSQSRSRYTMGELVNLMSVDAAKIYNLSKYLVLLWSAPIRIVISITLLWQYLGPACLAGVAIMVAMTPFSLVVAACSRKIQVVLLVISFEISYKKIRPNPNKLAII
ncbi:ABCC2 [Cordylochernes scorpioides]|uniref:ABCC2 n=1 Tax=Cordylochernes scorpioides TaxID=51811 RepID=A0ABY6KRU2_9ARAC|nr:ABCC2 [Cordylochernes scorpioides]